MAAYGSFHQIFENPIQNKTPKSLLETLSSSSSSSSSSPWNPIKSLHVTHHDETQPFTEIFGELHFKEPSVDNSNLQLCTEGLGSESYYDLLQDTKVNVKCNGNGEVVNEGYNEIIGVYKDNYGNGDDDIEEEWGPCKKEQREYPPPMTRMTFKTYRIEGRLVLEEVKIPKREILLASREDGRLRLKLVQPEEEDDDDEEDEEEEKKDKPL
ncbi:unnamed protein product [Cochlearia groenlandica]